MIHQEVTGSDNSGKLPSGGMLYSLTDANSMSAVIANPITFYGSWSVVINQDGQSGDLYNYYWTSYSRGTDGKGRPEILAPNWHNLYLDSYIPLRHKSIYDPCPYGYRVPSNGTYNEFKSHPGWIGGSFAGGLTWINSYIAAGTGFRQYTYGVFVWTGEEFQYISSTLYSNIFYYKISLFYNTEINASSGYYSARASSVRCIEDCDLLPDQTHSSD